MKLFIQSICVLALFLVVVKGEPTGLRWEFQEKTPEQARALKPGSSGEDDDTCTERNGECDEDEDCCGSKSVCTPALFTKVCRKWFLNGNNCEDNEDDDENDCCDLYTVCKKCKDDGDDCIMDDQCCGDLVCIYKNSGSQGKGGKGKTLSLGTCGEDV